MLFSRHSLLLPREKEDRPSREGVNADRWTARHGRHRR